MLVLVVDDSPEDLDVLRSQLWAEGHCVQVAPSGTAALRAMGEQRPDLVLCDADMPGLTVPLLLRTASLVFPGTPVLMMTDVGGSRGSQLFRFSARGYLEKPLQAAQILVCLEELASGAVSDVRDEKQKGTGDPSVEGTR